MIKYTLDQKIYKTERHADYDIAYNLPLDEPGSYVLILKFVELYFKNPGKRIFDIKLGETIIEKDFDIIAKGGYMAAVDEYYEFEYTSDGQIVFQKN